MVIRNVLSATVGSRSTRRTASAEIDRRAVERTATGSRRARVTSRVMRGGLPSSTSSGMSTGLRRRAARRSTHQAAVVGGRARRPRYGQRSRVAERRERRAARRARWPARSAPAPRCTRSRSGDMPGLVAGDARAASNARAAAAVVHQLGQRVRQAARADVVDREDRVVARPAPSSDRSPPGSAAASRRCRAAPRRSRGPPATPRRPSTTPRRRRGRSASPGPPSTTSGAPAGIVRLLHVLGADVAEAAGDHDRLVVAAHLAPSPGASTSSSKVRK